jgi:hypothetical protein
MKKLMLFCKLCLFHEKLSHWTVPGAIAASSTCTPEGGVGWSRNHSVSCVFLYSRSGHQRDASLCLCVCVSVWNAAGGLGFNSGFSSFADRRGQRARE